MSRNIIAEELIKNTKTLSRAVGKLSFASPVEFVYNPLQYAAAPHQAYIELYGGAKKKVIFMGMNPGPFGMAQTGVPFGEVSLVRDWMGVQGPVKKPKTEHPKRPIQGFECTRSEVSGKRLWGLFAQRFGTSKKFFKNHYVANYCPLIFMKDSSGNITPDKLPRNESEPLFAACDRFLIKMVDLLEPDWLIGVGKFAEKRAFQVLGEDGPKIGTILHPSPASPMANKDWPGTATKQLKELGIW